MSDHKNLAAALAAFQAEMPTVHKGKRANVGQYSYAYADLADITAAVAPVLAKHGLAYAGSARHTEGGRYEVVGILSHASGESREGALPIPPGSPQQVGSALTYFRRYLLGVMTGVVTDEDDDGAAASRPPAQRPQQRPPAPPADTGEAITDKQLQMLNIALKEAGYDTDEARFGFLASGLGREVTSTRDLTKAEATAAINHLRGGESA